jgi:protein phosphatase
MTYPGAPGDVYVICSDGLTKALSHEQILRAIDRSPTLAAAARELVESANAHGGRDNVTVVMFRLEAREVTRSGAVPLAAPLRSPLGV